MDIEGSLGAALSSSVSPRLWTASSGSPAIHFDPVLLEEIRAEAVRALHGMGRGGIEIGGILLGTAAEDRYTVQNWRPIRCDYSRGSSFLLSDRDIATLSCQIEAVQADPVCTGLLVVGWFVSRTRGSLDPRIEESQLHTRMFSLPGSLMLVIQPGRFGDAEIAIHVYEPGDPPSLRPLDPPLPVLAAQGVKPTAPLELDPAAPPPPAEDHLGAGKPPARHRWLAVVSAIAGVVFIALGAFAVWNSSSAATSATPGAAPPVDPPALLRPSGPPRQLLSLHVEGAEDAIRVSWDTSSPVLTNPQSGRLSVLDKGEVFVRSLSPHELRLGAIEYTRSLGEVRVQLTVKTTESEFSESAHYAPFRIPE